MLYFRGLSWQPFNPHIFCPLALEQNSHYKVFLLPKAFHLPGPLLSLGKYGGACETYMSEQGSLVPPLSPNEFWTFIYYLYMLYFKQASSLQLRSQCVCGIPVWAGCLFILIWRLQCTSRCPVAICFRHLCKDSITCKWNCHFASLVPLLPWQRMCHSTEGV